MRQATPSVVLRLHEDPSLTRRLRTALDRIGARYGLSPEELFELKVAATEAVTNAIKGSRGRNGVDVVVEPSEGGIEVEVRNRGSFEFGTSNLADIDSEGGRGIPLMFALVDEVEFASTSEGTQVRMRKRVHRGQPPEAFAGR
jgi:serine/threonine-protein kinase RsbW